MVQPDHQSFFTQGFSNEETADEIAEAVVTAVASEILLGENSEPLLEPLSDPWFEEEEKKQGEKEEKVPDEKEHVCDCAMMVAAKVSPQVLKNLYSDKCIIAFANIK
ncbi:hypothetical protein Hanom_Chr16g01457741 [Helianthus anomalus]